MMNTDEPSSTSPSPPLRCVLIKVGTQVITQSSSGEVATDRIQAIASGAAELRKRGIQVLIVSSGAVGLGRKALHLAASTSLSLKQACATVGQPLLMQAWSQALASHDLTVAQFLVTSLDFQRRTSYLNLENTLRELATYPIVPIINENDATAVEEIAEDSRASFGDNDRLSALIAGRLGVDTLLILTGTDGVYTENPTHNEDAKRLEKVASLRELDAIVTQGVSTGGRGGMAAKLTAVRAACVCGVTVRIGSGFLPNPVLRLIDSSAGTTIQSQHRISSRKSWIGLAAGFRGVITINEGASDALLRRGSSLLPIGILSVRGDFARFDVVQIEDQRGKILGRGLASYAAGDLKRILGKRSSEIREVFPLSDENEYPQEAIHRDNLLLFVGEADGTI